VEISYALPHEAAYLPIVLGFNYEPIMHQSAIFKQNRAMHG